MKQKWLQQYIRVASSGSGGTRATAGIEGGVEVMDDGGAGPSGGPDDGVSDGELLMILTKTVCKMLLRKL